MYHLLWKTWKNFGEIQMYTVEIQHISMSNIPNFSHTDCLKGVYYTHFQLFCNLPSRSNRLNHCLKLFIPTVQEYLLSYSCDRVDEFTSTESSYMVYENTCNILSGLSYIDLCAVLCVYSQWSFLWCLESHSCVYARHRYWCFAYEITFIVLVWQIMQY